MEKTTLLILVFFLSVVAYSQDTPPLDQQPSLSRVQVEGVLTAPVGEDLEGISVYNISSQRGTITDNEGKFTIAVAENDRVQFTALQFQKFTVIVDDGIVETKRMLVYVNPSVTQLDEVIVRPYNLTGNVNVDVGRIAFADVKAGLDLSWEAMEFDYEFPDDSQSSVKGNAAAEALGYTSQREGANILGLVGLFMNSVLNINGSERNSKPSRTEIAAIHISSLENRFVSQYFTETLGIPRENVIDFLYFVVEENDMDSSLMQDNNELQLMDHLYKKSRKYLLIINSQD